MDVKLQVVLFVLCALALYHEAQGWRARRGPSQGLRMPTRRHMITWKTYTKKVADRTWNEVYLLPILDSFPSDLLRYRPNPVRNGHDVFLAFTLRDETGVCRTETDYPWNTDFTHNPREKFAILNAGAGSQEDRLFSSNPDDYIYMVQCFNVSTIINGVCMGDGLLTFEVLNFPPNQLNWWAALCDLKRVMGISFLDRRWNFVAGTDGCP